MHHSLRNPPLPRQAVVEDSITRPGTGLQTTVPARPRGQRRNADAAPNSFVAHVGKPIGESQVKVNLNLQDIISAPGQEFGYDPAGARKSNAALVAVMPPWIYPVEVLRNSLQAGAQNIRFEVVEIDGVRKLAITDDGTGIASEYLDKVAHQFKTISGRDDTLAGNKGLGARAAALRSSPAGTVWQTRNADGEFQFVIRRSAEGYSLGTDPVPTSGNINTPTGTRLIFIGDSAEHETASSAWTGATRPALANTVQRRFFSIKQGVRVEFDKALIAGENWNPLLKPLQDIYLHFHGCGKGKSNKGAALAKARKETVVRVDESLTLHYFHLPVAQERASSYGLNASIVQTPLAFGVAFADDCASEMYSATFNAESSDIAAYLGLTDVYREVAVIAEISNPDPDAPRYVPNEHRTALIDLQNEGRAVTLRHFQRQAIQHRPEWLQALIAERRAKDENRFNAEADKEIEQWLKDMRALQTVLVEERDGNLTGGERTSTKVSVEHEHTTDKPIKPSKSPVLNPGDDRRAKAIAAAALAVEVRVVFDKQERRELGLHEYPARSREMPFSTTRTIHAEIDGEFGVIAHGLNQMKMHFAGQFSEDYITAEYKKRIEGAMRAAIGIGFAARKMQQASYGWSNDDAERSLDDPASSNLALMSQPCVERATKSMRADLTREAKVISIETMKEAA